MPDESLLSMRGAKKTSLMHGLIVGAASVLTMAAIVIVGLTIYDFVHQYGVPGASDVCQRSTRYMTLGQEERAINLLEESIQIKGSDKDAPLWREMLDQALYARGKKLAQEGKFRDAVTAFARISTTFANHDEVEKLIAENTDKGLTAVFGKGEDTDFGDGEKEKKSLSRIEKAVMTAVPGGKGHTGHPPVTSPALAR